MDRTPFFEQGIQLFVIERAKVLIEMPGIELFFPRFCESSDLPGLTIEIDCRKQHDDQDEEEKKGETLDGMQGEKRDSGQRICHNSMIIGCTVICGRLEQN